MKDMPTKQQELDAALEVIRATESHIPEGYRITKDTLPEQVSLVVAGLKAFALDRESLRRENAILREALEGIAHCGDDAQRKAEDALCSASNQN
jgi:hypothetical protein